jgi:hypothetical protein
MISQPQKILLHLRDGEVRAELLSGEYGLQLVEQVLRDDQREVAPDPRAEQSTRGACGDGSADEDAGVEDDACYRPVPRSRLMACSSSSARRIAS